MSLRPFRAHQLARVAAVKLATGADPVAVIQTAILSAMREDMDLPDCFGRLTPQQRETVLGLYGAGTVHGQSLATELGLNLNAMRRRLVDLAKRGLVERPGIGLYRLARGHGVRMTARRGSLDRVQHLEAWLDDHGETTPVQVGRAFGCSASAAVRRLQHLVARGAATHPRYGIYRSVRRRCA